MTPVSVEFRISAATRFSCTILYGAALADVVTVVVVGLNDIAGVESVSSQRLHKICGFDIGGESGG